MVKQTKHILIGLTFFLCLNQSFAANSNAELIYQKTAIEIKNGNLIKNLLFRIQINNRNGEKYTDISIPYSSDKKISHIEGTITLPDGRVVRKLKKKDIRKRNYYLSNTFYSDIFVKEFSLQHNSYPYIIEYSYQIRYNNFFFIEDWTPVLGRLVPTHQAELHLSIPESYPVAFTSQMVGPPDTLIDGEKKIVTWKVSYDGLLEYESYAPPLETFLPFVKIVPEKFSYEEPGSFANWKDFGNWQFALLKDLNKMPESEINKVQKIADGKVETKEKIRQLYHFLQDETRYINVAIETGGLKPYPANYVVSNKYGDCKALTYYFKTVLESVGINSYYTLVRAGNSVTQIDKNFPSQQFNHVILFIPLEQDSIWLDCTSDGPFNYLGTFTQNREALNIEKDNSHFIHTPALFPENVLETRRIQISRKSMNKASIKARVNFRGENFENLMYVKNDLSNDYKRQILHKYFIDPGMELDSFGINQKNRDSIHATLFYKATSSSIFQNYGKELLIRNLPFELPSLESPEERKLPVQIDFPLFRSDTIIYNLESKIHMAGKSKDFTLSSPFGSYSTHTIVSEKNITVIKKLLINSGKYDLEKYSDFYSFLKDIKNNEKKLNILLTQ